MKTALQIIALPFAAVAALALYIVLMAKEEVI